ncbi:HAD family hydrolase [Opitutus sp. ER46]|uniref:HAD family hydrolase n=1 Tax=Opitutus sp. ER46 TaxID=2161864 RepID=UPI000D31187B|nr:HAD family hydrolase [Opitutus sp. ER46]PTX98497.1 haloacid dehalogenase [Opitutus sp. ER46]
MSNWRVIGFDADDTLWHNEVIFERVHARYRELLARYHDAATVDRTLFATEMRNLELYGYGVKGFTLSAIETAIELTGGQISAEEIRTLIGLGHEMLRHPVELLDGAREVLHELAPNHALILITKGDLRDQERKLAKSGLAPLFAGVEIVSEKDEASYARVLQRHNIRPAEFLMVGNSLKSDILPVLALGGSGAHVPYPLLWQHERTVALPQAPGRFFELSRLRDLLPILQAPTAAAPAAPSNGGVPGTFSPSRS